MSVRVVARIRPLQDAEREADVIVHTANSSPSGGSTDNLIKIPIPKNESQEYTFQFQSVYGPEITQQEIFDAEIAPTIKHLLSGFDVTVFAYGVTGTGKTYTMRGGETPESRGVIPRLLNGLHNHARRMEESNHEIKVDLLMSYYEIYNDKVYDLFEDPDKRTALGLPLREAGGGKTVVVGLTERSCSNLKEFERLYDQANGNRSTGATKLNAHSSRSHAILCVKVVVTTGNTKRISTVSAIDLAGSEDNRRTDNGKERMVESASINRSLFVLAQCVEAISKQQARIPYRESKMTRILSLGQNKGRTVMILNLAPTRSYYLDTLSSLNFANRTRKIEVREIEHAFISEKVGMPKSPSYMNPRKPPPIPVKKPSTANSSKKIVAPSPKKQPPTPFTIQGSPLKPPLAPNEARPPVISASNSTEKLSAKPSGMPSPDEHQKKAVKIPRLSSSKLPRTPITMRPATPPLGKALKPVPNETPVPFTELSLEERIEAAIAARLKELDMVNDSLRRQLREVERRVEEMEYTRTEGLLFLLMAKQHHARGEDPTALRLYLMALPFFPHNEKLKEKIAKLRRKLGEKSVTIEQQLYGRRKALVQTAEITLNGDESSFQPSKTYENLVKQAEAKSVPKGQYDDEFVATQLPSLPKEILGEQIPVGLREKHTSVFNLPYEGYSTLTGSGRSSPATADRASIGSIHDATTYFRSEQGIPF
ncbi:hypothetical protein KEM54_005194 [Ascosphaera aggregata]|nr:hypothetical protein KEM54_005194 [Ascosphaera aggregata]